MSRSENRHYTKKWKKRRKDHFGDKCKRANCGICHPEKKYGKSKVKYTESKNHNYEF